MPPLFRIDVGKEVLYCLDEAERDLLLDRIEAEKKTRQGERDALQGPRRDEPVAAPRDDDGEGNAPARAALSRRRDHGVERARCSTSSSPRSARPIAATGYRTKGNLADIGVDATSAAQ